MVVSLQYQIHMVCVEQFEPRLSEGWFALLITRWIERMVKHHELLRRIRAFELTLKPRGLLFGKSVAVEYNNQGIAIAKAVRRLRCHAHRTRFGEREQAKVHPRAESALAFVVADGWHERATVKDVTCAVEKRVPVVTLDTTGYQVVCQYVEACIGVFVKRLLHQRAPALDPVLHVTHVDE